MLLLFFVNSAKLACKYIKCLLNINIFKLKGEYYEINSFVYFFISLYSELSADQKLKFNKSLQISGIGISKAV